MKKFLALVLCIVMAFSLTACKGSEEDGTKGSFTGNTFTATWEKALFGDTIKLKINSNNINEEYEWTEELYNYEGSTTELPISIQKELGVTSATYEVTPITDYLTEENSSMTVPVMIRCSKGDGKLDTAVELICNFTVSLEPVLSLNVELNAEQPAFESAGENLSYDVTYAGEDLDLLILLSSGKQGIWSTKSYDEKLFDVNGPDTQSDGKSLFTVTGLDEGKGTVVLYNSGTGKSYDVECISSLASGEGEDALYKVEMTGINEQACKMTVKDVPGYEKVTGTKVEKKDKDGNVVKDEKGNIIYEEVTEGIDVGFDIEEIVIPEEVVVIGMDVLDEEELEEGSDIVYMEVYVDENKWLYTASSKCTTEELSSVSDSYYESAIQYQVDQGMTKQEAQKLVDDYVIDEKVTINGKTVDYYGADKGLCFITWSTGGVNYCLENYDGLTYEETIEVAKQFVK